MQRQLRSESRACQDGVGSTYLDVVHIALMASLERAACFTLI